MEQLYHTALSIPESGYAHGHFFTRSTLSGAKRLSGEVFLEPESDAVSKPLPLLSLKMSFPTALTLLQERASEWEQTLKSAVQVEFEITEHKLRLGAPKPLECSPRAAITIACSLVREGVITKEESLQLVRPEELRKLLYSSVSEASLRQSRREGRLLIQSDRSTGGAVSGVLAFDSESAWSYHNQGLPVILCCHQLTYSERKTLTIASGALIAEGATIAAQLFEIPCVVVSHLTVTDKRAQFGEKVLKQGDWICLDGQTGCIFSGQVELQPGRLTDDALTLLEWADKIRLMEVRANASTVDEVHQALALGAEGVGLCRLETLLQHENCLASFQAALKEICLGQTENSPAVSQSLQELEVIVCEFFQACQAFQHGAVTVRLADVSLSVMLSNWMEYTELSPDYLTEPMQAWLDELNPVQGLRGGRLSVMYPVFMRFQLRLLLRAWSQAVEPNTKMRLQIMMPGVTDVQELRILRECTQVVAKEDGLPIPELGSMLELPRACLTADELSSETDFLSFGTGDLTESTCGLSRYDSHLSFLPIYLDREVFPRDPFTAIDQKGVGALMRLAVTSVHEKCPTFELGICGAQAIDPDSLQFCHQLGLKYASVPAYHVPVARLVAAQSVLAAVVKLS